MTLIETKPQNSYIILAVKMQEGILQRLKNLGLTTGAQVTTLRFALRKKNILIFCAGLQIALRCDIASKITVRKC